MAKSEHQAPLTQDDMMHKFADGKVFERVFNEGIGLVEEAANYLDGEGRSAAKDLPREASLTYSAWSMELTSRLMQAASWLVMQKAVRDGDMQQEDARNERYRVSHSDQPPLDVSAQRGLGLPDGFLDLVERAEALFDRICRLDEAMYQSPGQQGSPIHRQLRQLEQAAADGTFDPLSVWSKMR